MQQDNQPFELLKQWSVKVDEALDSQKSKKDFSNLQSSIGFMLCGQAMSSSVGDVIEILNVPRFTLIPGAKDWVLGVANVRGTLIPVIDLERFFGGSSSTSRKTQRTLVVEHNDYRVGLVVSMVTGLQHLNSEDMATYGEHQNTAYADYIDQVYEYENGEWLIFNPKKLFSSEEFMDASMLSVVKSSQAA